MKTPVFCVGASAGGIAAFQEILVGLPENFENPIIVTQHIGMDAHTELDFNLIFSRYYKGSIVNVVDKTQVRDRSIYFAPAAYHLLIEKDFSLSLSQEDSVHFSRPSIDVFFESAAWSLGSKCCAILLTGANCDGARGLFEVKNHGGITVVQNPKTAANSPMPQSALDLFSPAYVLDLEKIPKFMVQVSGGVKHESENTDCR